MRYVTFVCIGFYFFVILSFCGAEENENNALVWLDIENEAGDAETETDQSETLSGELFRPTTEWQDVKPGRKYALYLSFTFVSIQNILSRSNNTTWSTRKVKFGNW